MLADPAGLRIQTDTGAAGSEGFVAFWRQGSRLVIDHPVLHASLARIGLALVWQNFPSPRGGLGKYYQGYALDPPIRDADYVVGVTAPLPGWTGGRRMRLFGAGGRTRFDLAARGAKRVAAAPLTLELVAPAHGFGDEAYSPSLTAASLRAAQGERVALPNPPWRAMVSRVELRVMPAWP